MLLDYLIFQRVQLKKEYVFKFDYNYQEFFIKAEDGVEINALLFEPETESKGLVLYFHGNADNLQRWGKYAIDITKLGYQVLMIDYRGYGKSTGKPEEQALYNDARTIWLWAKENLKFDRLILYGRSLGSSIASQLAMEVNPALLVLETPFDELKGVMSPMVGRLFSLFSPKHIFPTKRHLDKVKCQKLIFHGTKDLVVPLESALRLKPLLSTEDQFIIIQDGKHRNLRDFDMYHKKLAEQLG